MILNCRNFSAIKKRETKDEIRLMTVNLFASPDSKITFPLFPFIFSLLFPLSHCKSLPVFLYEYFPPIVCC